MALRGSSLLAVGMSGAEHLPDLAGRLKPQMDYKLDLQAPGLTPSLDPSALTPLRNPEPIPLS